MGRKPCYDSKDGLNKGPWTEDEDLRLTRFIRVHGEGCSWSAVPKKAGLKRCGKSCRFRWVNYLRPSVKRGDISPDEEDLIIRLHKLLGNRWSLIAGRIPGRTDNEVKNYWNTRLNKKAHASGCIGWKSTKPRKANISKQAVTILTPKSANQEGEKEKVICNPVIEDLKKGSTSSNYRKKQEASSSSDSRKLAAVSAEMDLWNSLQLNLNILPSWAYSNILHDDFKSAFLPVPFVYNEENVHPLSCMFDTENVWQDYVDHQMYSILHNSLPSSEVGVNSDTVTVVPHMDDFADIFNSFPI